MRPGTLPFINLLLIARDGILAASNIVIANPGITIRREPALKDLIRDC